MKKSIFFLVAQMFMIASPLSSSAELLAKLEDAMVYPIIDPRLSSGYGNRTHPIYKATKHHSGLDLAAPEKSHVRSVLKGMIIFAGTLPGYGKVVSVKHNDQDVSLYGHLSSIDVKIGDQISAGTVIGRVGQTGHATGPHLHFEWRKDGKPVNPLKVFPQIASEAVG